MFPSEALGILKVAEDRSWGRENLVLVPAGREQGLNVKRDYTEGR